MVLNRGLGNESDGTMIAISVVRLTRWLSSLHIEKPKEEAPRPTEKSSQVSTATRHTPPRSSRHVRTLSSKYSSEAPSVYVTPPSTPTVEVGTTTIEVTQLRSRPCPSFSLAASHRSRSSGKLPDVEMGSEGRSSWASGDVGLLWSDGVNSEPKSRHSWTLGLGSSGRGSGSWDECGFQGHRRSLGSGSWDEVEIEVNGDDGAEGEKGDEKDTRFDGRSRGDAHVCKGQPRRDEEVLSDYTAENSEATEWEEGIAGDIPGYRTMYEIQHGPSAYHLDHSVSIDTSPTSAMAASHCTDSLGASTNTSPTVTPSQSPTPSLTISLPGELFGIVHTGGGSSMASFSSVSVDDTGSTAATAASSSGNGGTYSNYFEGASNFGVNSVNVVNVHVTVHV